MPRPPQHSVSLRSPAGINHRGYVKHNRRNTDEQHSPTHPQSRRRPHAKQGSHILSRLHLLKQAHPSGIHLGTFWHDGQSQLRQKRYRKTTKLRCRWLHSRNKLYRHHRDDGSSPEHPLHRANDKIIANVNLSQPSHA